MPTPATLAQLNDLLAQSARNSKRVIVNIDAGLTKNRGYNRSGHMLKLVPCYLISIAPSGRAVEVRALTGKHANTFTAPLNAVSLPKSVLVSAGFTIP